MMLVMNERFIVFAKSVEK